MRAHKHALTCAHIHTHARTHTNTHMHTQTHTRTHTNTHARTHARTDTHTHTETYTHTHTHTHVRTRTHARTHARTHTHTHTHTQVLGSARERERDRDKHRERTYQKKKKHLNTLLSFWTSFSTAVTVQNVGGRKTPNTSRPDGQVTRTRKTREETARQHDSRCCVGVQIDTVHDSQYGQPLLKAAVLGQWTAAISSSEEQLFFGARVTL